MLSGPSCRALLGELAWTHVTVKEKVGGCWGTPVNNSFRLGQGLVGPRATVPQRNAAAQALQR